MKNNSTKSDRTMFFPMKHVVALFSALFLFLIAGNAAAQTIFTVDGMTYKTLTSTTVQVGDGTNSAVTTNVLTVNIPATVNSGTTTYSITSVGPYAFSGCTSMTLVSLPASLTSIGNSAFASCSALTSISLPTSLTSIGSNAFASCSALTSMSLPASVTTIGNTAFANCAKLPAFSVDAANTSFSTAGGVLFNFNKTTLIAYPRAKSGASYAIPSGVTNIGNSAFLSCSGLTSITLPAGLTTLGDASFQNTNVSSIFLPASVTAISGNPFFWCTKLTAFSVDPANTSFSTLDGVLYNYNKTFIVSYPKGKTATSYTLPSGVTIIGPSAFSGITALNSVVLPSVLTEIKSYAFSGCSNLSSLYYLGSKEPNILSWAFNSSPSGRTLYLPNASSGFTASKWGAASVAYNSGNFGSVKASITGPAAAQWRIVGVTDWTAATVTMPNVAVGDYQVEFSPVPRWIAPTSVPVTVSIGSTVTASGTYTEDVPVSLSMMEAE